MNIKRVNLDKAILVMGYDWEKYGGNENKEQNRIDIDDSIKGIKTIFKSHVKFNVPFTLFALGKVLEVQEQVENCCRLIDKYNFGSYVDIQQHAYSHTPFLKLPSKDKKLSADEAVAEIENTKKLLKSNFKRECVGLRPPYGHFEGLQRNPALMAKIAKCGIKFISSDLRNQEDQFPPEWTDSTGNVRQPYWYNVEEYSVLEIPTQGNSDNLYRGVSKYVKTKPLNSYEILDIHVENLKKALKDNLVYVPLFHVWVVGRYDEEGEVISGLLNFASRNDIKIMSYIDLWKLLSEKASL